MLVKKISLYVLIIMVACMNTIISCTRQEKQVGLQADTIKCMTINVWSGLDYYY